MDKLFVATSFSGQVDYETGNVFPEFKKDLSDILDRLRTIGKFSVFCAIEYEGWRISKTNTPGSGVKIDLGQINQADAVLQVMNPKVSAGLQSEGGFALAQGKPLILASSPGITDEYWNKGLLEIGQARQVIYKNALDLALQTTEILHHEDWKPALLPSSQKFLGH